MVPSSQLLLTSKAAAFNVNFLLCDFTASASPIAALKRMKAMILMEVRIVGTCSCDQRLLNGLAAFK